MAISLVKGQNTALDSGLKKVIVGLGWKPRQERGENFDLDVSAFMLADSDKVRSDADFIFYNQPTSTCSSVKYQGDNLVGTQQGDAEQVVVDLPSVPADVARVVFSVTIHKAVERKQNFGMVADAYIRIVDEANGEEIARFDLSEDACVNQAILFGELYRRNGAWKFRALGQSVEGDLGTIARGYGVNV